MGKKNTSSATLIGLGLVVSTHVHGLGLGEVFVSSAIGQPFQAYIELIDPPADLTSTCFQLKGIDDSGLSLPTNLHLNIERQPSKPARLKITSTRPIYEPALAFTASSLCEIRISRDYTVLLDPIIQAEPPQLETLPKSEPPPPTLSKPAVKSSLPRPATLKRRVASTVPVASKQTDQRPPVRKNNPAGSAKQDRLILTRGTSPAPLAAGASAPPPKAMSLDELADENTALNLKLEHLEKQLAALQKRHADLVAQIQVKNQTVVKDETMNTFSYVILAISLALFLAAAWLFQQRTKRKQATFAEEATDIQRIRRANSPVIVAGMEMESMPALNEEISHPANDSDIPEHSSMGEPEIHDGLADEVEVFVAHGQHSLAIQLLEEHIQRDALGSTGPWLLLLDLLHRAGDAVKYEEIRKRCRNSFNIIVPTFDTYDSNLPATGIESYRHVMAQLVSLWQTPKTDAYLATLLHDNRGGNRVGFDPGAYDEILLLRDVRKLIASA